MIDAAERAGVRLVVGHSHSFDRADPARARDHRERRVGAVRMITAQYYTDFLYRLRRPEELDTARGGGVGLQPGRAPGRHRPAARRRATSRARADRRAGIRRGRPKARTRRCSPSTTARSPRSSTAATRISTATSFAAASPSSARARSGATTARRGGSSRVRRRRRGSRAKAARNYGGADYARDAAAALPPRRASHQHFGLVLVSCERADLRPLPDGVMIYGDDEAPLEPLPPPRVPRAEVIDELYDAVVARPAAAPRRALGDGHARGLPRDAAVGARGPRHRAARSGRLPS